MTLTSNMKIVTCREYIRTWVCKQNWVPTHQNLESFTSCIRMFLAYCLGNSPCFSWNVSVCSWYFSGERTVRVCQPSPMVLILQRFPNGTDCGRGEIGLCVCAHACVCMCVCMMCLCLQLCVYVCMCASVHTYVHIHVTVYHCNAVTYCGLYRSSWALSVQYHLEVSSVGAVLEGHVSLKAHVLVCALLKEPLNHLRSQCVIASKVRVKKWQPMRHACFVIVYTYNCAVCHFNSTTPKGFLRSNFHNCLTVSKISCR